MKCPNCETTFKATPVDGRVTCPECGKKLKVKQKAVETPKEEVKAEEVKEEGYNPKKEEERLAQLEEAKKPVKKETRTFEEEDDDDPFGDDDLFEEKKPIKKSEPKRVTPAPVFDYDEDEDEDEDEDDDFDDEEDDIPVIKKEQKPKKVNANSGVNVSGEALTFKTALLSMLLTCIPFAGFIILILGAIGVMFKDNISVRNLYRAMLAMYVIAIILSILFMMIAGAGIIGLVSSLG